MEIKKKIFNRWSMLLLIIGSIVAFIVVDNAKNLLFEGLLFYVLPFYIVLYSASFFHSFFFTDMSEKLFVGTLDIFPIFVYFINVGFVEGNLPYSLIVGFTTYLLSIIIIALLSWSLTYLWRRYKK